MIVLATVMIDMKINPTKLERKNMGGKKSTRTGEVAAAPQVAGGAVQAGVVLEVAALVIVGVGEIAAVVEVGAGRGERTSKVVAVAVAMPAKPQSQLRIFLQQLIFL